MTQPDDADASGVLRDMLVALVVSDRISASDTTTINLALQGVRRELETAGAMGDPLRLGPHRIMMGSVGGWLDATAHAEASGIFHLLDAGKAQGDGFQAASIAAIGRLHAVFEHVGLDMPARARQFVRPE